MATSVKCGDCRLVQLSSPGAPCRRCGQRLGNEVSDSLRPLAQSQNPYAPPQTEANTNPARAKKGQPPALFNPNAAANWSLLLTPAFGAFLHWRNWKALGEDKGLAWFAGCALVVPFLGAMSAARVPGVGLLFLGLWYFSAARPQVKFVEERWGTDYPRRSMLSAVLSGVAILVLGTLLLLFLVSSAFRASLGRS